MFDNHGYKNIVTYPTGVTPKRAEIARFRLFLRNIVKVGRGYQKKLSTYASEVESWLKECPYLTSPQILDRLKENHPSMPEVSDKTV